MDKPGLTLKEAHQQLIRRQSNQESMQLDEVENYERKKRKILSPT